MKTPLLWALASCLVCLPATAHHGTSNYAGVTETITLEGTVTEFAWSNPHVFVLFDVTDGKGNIAHWAGEMNSPGVLKAGVIWTNGRALPKDPDPQWMGYSSGKWDGDTFVVNSLGFDERTWFDHFGNPVSDDMTLEERYRRIDRDTLELDMVINAPKAYTKPWVSEKKTFRLAPKTEIQELFCVPSEEQRFNQLVRDPGSGITKK